MLRKILCSALLAAILISFSPAHAQATKRIALVVGNGNYVFSPLKNPSSDAKLIARSLEEAGFKVALKLDQDQRAFKRAIRDFGQALLAAGEDAVGLFYYAGHGIQVGGENYMIPIRADIRTESDVGIEAVRVNNVLSYMGEAGNRLNFVIMDACRNNPFARSMRSAARGLARMDAPGGTLIAYATAPGKVALDGSGNNSPYSEALAEYIAEPGISVERMFKKVRSEVLEETGRQQVPWESSSLTGDFYFTPDDEDDAPAPMVDLDLETWRSVATSMEPAVIETYLVAFPTGKFAAVAKAKIDALTRQQAVQVETTFWREVADSRDPALLRTYLNRYPDGAYAVLARQKIETLGQSRPGAAPMRIIDAPQQTAVLKPVPPPLPAPTGNDGSVMHKWGIYLDYEGTCVRQWAYQDLETDIDLTDGKESLSHRPNGSSNTGMGEVYVNFYTDGLAPGQVKIRSIMRRSKAYVSADTVLSTVRAGETYALETNHCTSLSITFKKRLD